MTVDITADVDSNRQTGDMRWENVDIDTQNRVDAAEPHGPDSQIITPLDQYFLKTLNVLLGISHPDGPAKGLLSQQSGFFKGAAHTHAHNDRCTGIWRALLNGFQYKLLNALDACLLYTSDAADD